jgi:hypothetical protein
MIAGAAQLGAGDSFTAEKSCELIGSCDVSGAQRRAGKCVICSQITRILEEGALAVWRVTGSEGP